MLKILVGVGLGFLLFSSPDARQITADLLRTAADAIAPADEDRTLEDRINEVLVGELGDYPSPDSLISPLSIKGALNSEFLQ
tara:strand:- start:1011 stop:1256 length:246 start_codon:yes stop_codon:yes gene_type:complete